MHTNIENCDGCNLDVMLDYHKLVFDYICLLVKSLKVIPQFVWMNRQLVCLEVYWRASCHAVMSV